MAESVLSFEFMSMFTLKRLELEGKRGRLEYCKELEEKVLFSLFLVVHFIFIAVLMILKEITLPSLFTFGNDLNSVEQDDSELHGYQI